MKKLMLFKTLVLVFIISVLFSFSSYAFTITILGSGGINILTLSVCPDESEKICVLIETGVADPDGNNTKLTMTLGTVMSNGDIKFTEVEFKGKLKFVSGCMDNLQGGGLFFESLEED